MKHASTRELYDYWTSRRGTRAAPERNEIEPGAIRRVLADTFMLNFDPRGGHPFRIAGTRVCAAFGRELKGAAFTEIWDADSRQLVRDILAVVATESVGVVAAASGQSRAGAPLGLELLALPLAHRGGASTRILGALVPDRASLLAGRRDAGGAGARHDPLSRSANRSPLPFPPLPHTRGRVKVGASQAGPARL